MATIQGRPGSHKEVLRLTFKNKVGPIRDLLELVSGLPIQRVGHSRILARPNYRKAYEYALK